MSDISVIQEKITQELLRSPGITVSKPSGSPRVQVNVQALTRPLGGRTSVVPGSVIPELTPITFSSTIVVKPLNEAQVISSMKVTGRIKYLARREPISFIIALCGFFVSIYIIFKTAAIVLGDVRLFSLALAQVTPKSEPTAADLFLAARSIPVDWFVAVMMSALMIGCLSIAAFASNEKKIGPAWDVVKMIGSFLVGFGGGKAS
jgi:hypothetical protein